MLDLRGMERQGCTVSPSLRSTLRRRFCLLFPCSNYRHPTNKIPSCPFYLLKVHMTNTRITDPEILERRYPVLLHQFSIRKGSGGQGEFNGGDGVIRELEFTEPLQVSILSEVSLNQTVPSDASTMSCA